MNWWNSFVTRTKGHRQAEEPLKVNEGRYRAIFQMAAVSIWEIEWSEAKSVLDQIRSQEVGGIGEYLNQHPESVNQIASKIKVVDVNDSTLKLFEAPSKDQFLSSIQTILLPESIALVQDDLLAILKGEPHFAGETVFQTFNGRCIHVLCNLLFSVHPDDANYAWITMVDISQQKMAEEVLRQEAQKLRSLIENTSDWFWQTGVNLTLSYSSPTVNHLIGYSLDEINGKKFIDLMPNEKAGQVSVIFEEAAARHERVSLPEITLLRKGGSEVVVELSATPLFNAEGTHSGFAGVCRDITGRKQAEWARSEVEERYSLAVQGANDGIWDWDLVANRIYYSPRWKNILGYAENGLRESPDEWLGRIHPEDVSRVKADLKAHLEGRTPFFESEHRIFYRTGRYHWVLARGLAKRDENNKAYRMAGSLTDINARKVTEERLRQDAMRDLLTGLPNRTYFLDQVRRSIERSRRHADYTAAMILLDLDRFQLVNDSLGHNLGDQLLVMVAYRLKSCLRSNDTVARFGGDEFGILLEDINGVNEALWIAQRLQQELSHPIDLQGHEVFTTASMGIVLIAANYERPEDLLRDADTAMFRAKANGRARHQLFDTEMHARSLSLLRLDAEMRRAIERQEFEVYYQPIVAVEATRAGKIIAVEALVRWNHPQRGLLLPGEFIHVAEGTGLIVRLGEWVLREACIQTKKWHDAGYDNLLVSVNISARQFRDQNLPEIVRQALHDSGIPGHMLQLEITESAAVEDIDLTNRMIRELTGMGLKIAIDDFGTSYSALGYLKRFHVSSLKIDRSFITDITKNEDDAAITAAMIAIGKSLALSVVAEGVETNQQLDFLSSHHCDKIQGFLYGCPITSEQISHILENGGVLQPGNEECGRPSE